ncbi:hypothetical protein DFR50_109116 [Roseiarcus fermentans]|uniref:Uncharacterized protein n=1 Tax=Roseiarcus fermentans TaxID=1473586 RepID=A0A366FI58_9HYPH|nr:hypothetical protein [Roseiarcus fermentans]RBP14363.1 hypothetical protein DFR50_109116 [Roseiarcus fermentans]
MAALASASASLTADALAASFKQGRKVAPKVAAVHAALALSNDIRKGTSGDPHGMGRNNRPRQALRPSPGSLIRRLRRAAAKANDFCFS